MSLYEQLKSLSAVAHLAHTFFTHHNACSAFIPSPLYHDIQIMVKNAFFFIAKTKQDNPNGEFFLILLGTDCLESIFGLVRSQSGSNVNVRHSRMPFNSLTETRMGSWPLLTLAPGSKHGNRDGAEGRSPQSSIVQV